LYHTGTTKTSAVYIGAQDDKLHETDTEMSIYPQPIHTELSTTATDTYPFEYHELYMSSRQFLRYFMNVHQHSIHTIGHITINITPHPMTH
jgi:hypothetical protein